MSYPAQFKYYLLMILSLMIVDLCVNRRIKYSSLYVYILLSACLRYYKICVSASAHNLAFFHPSRALCDMGQGLDLENDGYI